ncbi:MAG: 4-(cytidine 5'-diphospho)-2-C-methyl-D-erythritol kinase [candidate division WOR-3 bacterium]
MRYLVKSFCKINLFLDVLNKREDGFHEILTIFQSIDLFDSIEVYESKNFGIEFFNNDCQIDPENNTVYKSYQIFKEAFLNKSKREWVDFHFKVNKMIPSGAGLGGGSADGSSILNFLNFYYDYPFQNEELRQLSSKVGADCPFLVEGGSAIGRGIGEKLEFFDIPEIENLKIFIISPNLHVSTKEAYYLLSKYLTNDGKSYNIINSKIDYKNLKSSFKYFYNIFERVVFEKYPLLKDVKERITKYEPLLSLMSGSGSSIFAIFENERHFDSLKKEFGGNRIFFTTPITRNRIKKELLTKIQEEEWKLPK